MNTGLNGKVALVTGAGNGLGAAISKQLAQEGARVALADISLGAAEAQTEQLRKSGAEVIAVRSNVIVSSEVNEMVAQVEEGLGPIDILVNNAGFTRDMRINKMEENDWDSVVDVILKGAYLCTKAVVDGMIERKWGRVINMSSRAHRGNKGQANYSAGKAGLVGFTKAMALELGAFDITVNAIAPGIIGTEAVRNLPHFDAILTNAEKNTPIRRIGEPEDVAALATFLASELSGYITGELIHVSGGRY